MTSEGSATPRGPYDGEVDVITDSEEMAAEFARLFHENGEYYELMKPLIRLETATDAYQWVFGRDFDATDVSIPFGTSDAPRSVRFDPDGKTYSRGGVLVDAYLKGGIREARVAVQTEPPEKGVNVSEKQSTVERMEVHYDV